MKNKELEKRYKGDDLKQAKLSRNRIKRGKLIRWISGDKKGEQMCAVDTMVMARNM